MKYNFKFWRTIPLIFLGFSIIYKLINGADNVFFFDGVILYGLEFIFICILCYSLFIDREDYQQTKSNLSFLPTTIGFLILVSFCITQLLIESRNNSKLIIQANYDGGFNGCGFEFREDGSYKFFNGSGFDYFRGRYELKDSIIILDKTDIDNVIKSGRLLIRELISENTSTKIIYQINNNNQIIPNLLDFNVNEDYRNK